MFGNFVKFAKEAVKAVTREENDDTDGNKEQQHEEKENNNGFASSMMGLARQAQSMAMSANDESQEGQQGQGQQGQGQHGQVAAMLQAVQSAMGGESTAKKTSTELPDGASIPRSKCDGTRKCLFIGINYYGSRAELRGCLNDVKNIKKFLKDTFKFPVDVRNLSMTLTDDSQNKGTKLYPTKENIMNAMKWLVKDAQEGDSLFFHYSGHGGTQQDIAPDTDEIDGQDETLVPVDYESTGQIVDDDIHAILVAGLPQGVRLTAIMDCCHSGSVFDLPFTYTIDGKLAIQEVDNRKKAIENAIAAGMAYMKGDQATAVQRGQKAIQLFMRKNNTDSKFDEEHVIKIRSSLAEVIQFSGCRDEQTSADANIGGQATGACSYAFINAFKRYGKNQTYTELLKNVREYLNGKYTQVPQMSTGLRMDMKAPFII